MEASQQILWHNESMNFFLIKYLSVCTEEVSQYLQPSVKHGLGSKLNSEPRKEDFCYLVNIFLIKKQWLTKEVKA